MRLALLLLFAVSLRADPITPGAYAISGTGVGGEICDDTQECFARYPDWTITGTIFWTGGAERSGFKGTHIMFDAADATSSAGPSPQLDFQVTGHPASPALWFAGLNEEQSLYIFCFNFGPVDAERLLMSFEDNIWFASGSSLASDPGAWGTFSLTRIPEPGTFALAISGLLLIGYFHLRRRTPR